MSFTKRKIDITFQLGLGKFGEDGYDTLTLKGHRSIANIAIPGGDSMGALQLRIYGLSESVMNRLTTIGPINRQIRRNTVSVSAGDDTSGMSEVFVGTINDAWADFNRMPEVSLNVTALTGLLEAVKPISPRSYQGSANVALIMADLAAVMGVAFENNGVSVQLANPYFSGSAWQQALSCAHAADINMVLESGILSIWPRAGARAGGIPTISPETGLAGYPTFSSKGISLQTIFNGNIRVGGQMEVRSSLKGASGVWNIFNVSHALESEVPGGAWATFVEGATASDTGLIDTVGSR